MCIARIFLNTFCLIFKKKETVKTTINFTYYLDKAISFEEYLTEQVKLVDRVNAGEDLNFSQYLPINLQRLKRGLKTSEVSNELIQIIDKIGQPITWLVLTEHWCGDAAQTLALFHRISELSDGKITLRLIYRDQNLELMDNYLTNGGRSIPKLIQLNNKFEVTGTWGPRPQQAQELTLSLKSAGKDYTLPLHKWYAKDKLKSTEKEIIELLLNR